MIWQMVWFGGVTLSFGMINNGDERKDQNNQTPLKT